MVVGNSPLNESGSLKVVGQTQPTAQIAQRQALTPVANADRPQQKTTWGSADELEKAIKNSVSVGDEQGVRSLLDNPVNRDMLRTAGLLVGLEEYVLKALPVFKNLNAIYSKLLMGDRSGAEEIMDSEATRKIYEIAYGNEAARMLSQNRVNIAIEAEPIIRENEIFSLLEKGDVEGAKKLLANDETLRIFSLSQKEKPENRIKRIGREISIKAIPLAKIRELREIAAQGPDGLAKALSLLDNDAATKSALIGVDIQKIRKMIEEQAPLAQMESHVNELLNQGHLEEAKRALTGNTFDYLEDQVSLGSVISLAKDLIIVQGSREPQKVELGRQALLARKDDLAKFGMDVDKLINAFIVMQNVEVLSAQGNYQAAIDYLTQNNNQFLKILDDSGEYKGADVLSDLRKRLEATREGLGTFSFNILSKDPVNMGDPSFRDVELLNGDATPRAFSDMKEIAVSLSKITDPAGASYLTASPDESLAKPHLLAKALYAFYVDHRPQLMPTAENKTLNILALPKDGEYFCNAVQIPIDANLMNQLAKSALVSQGMVQPREISFGRIPDQGLNIEEVYSINSIRDPKKFAAEHPFAALKVRLWQNELPISPESAMPQTVSDVLASADIRLLAKQLSPASTLHQRYFHRPLNEAERASVRTFRDTFAKGSVEYEAISELLGIPTIDIADPSNPKITLIKYQEEALQKLSLQSPLIAELMGSYFSDGDSSPLDANALYALADWMDSGKSGPLSIQADLKSQRSADEAYMAGRDVLLAQVWSSSVAFDPRKSKTFNDNIASRMITDTVSTAAMVLSQGSRPTMISMGINSAENWKMILLKRKYWGEEKWASFLSMQDVLNKELDQTIVKIEELRNNASLTNDQKRERLQPHIENYSYLKGRIDALVSQLFIVDEEFFDWFVSNYAVESNADLASDLIFQRMNESEFGSTVMDPFTGKEIRLSDLPEILQSARDSESIRQDLGDGWLSLDPGKGAEQSRQAKMAMALMISYLQPNGHDLEKSNPNTEHAQMVANQILLASPPVQHLGASIKGDLLFIFRADPVKKGTLARSLETPDEFDASTVSILMDAIKMVGKDGENDPEYARLRQVRDSLGDKKVLVRSDLFEDPNVQEIMQGYYYLGKLFSKNMGIPSDSSKGQNTGGEQHSWLYNAANLALGGMVDQVLSSKYDQQSLSGRRAWYENSLSELMNVGSIENPVAETAAYVGTNAGMLIPSAVKEFSGTLLRFGPWMGVNFGWSLPFSFIKSGYNAAVGEVSMAIDETTGLPLEDKEGRLVFKSANVDDIAKNGLNLATQMAIFMNDPFLLYGWLGVGEDFEQEQWLSAAIKMWAANFYLMMPGKNGFWSSTWGKGLSIDRFAWRVARMAWDFKNNITDLAKRQGISSQQLEQQLKESGLDTIFTEASRYSNVSDFTSSLIETASRKGMIGAVTEKIGDTDIMHRFMTSKAGAMVRTGQKVGSMLLSPNPLLTLLKQKAQSRGWAYAADKGVDLYFKVPLQYANLMHWEKRAIISGSRILGMDRVSSGSLLQEYNPASGERVYEVDGSGKIKGMSELPDSSVQIEEPLQAELVPAETRKGMAVAAGRSNPSRVGTVGVQDFDAELEAKINQTLATLCSQNGRAKQIIFNVKTGDGAVEAVSLPVRRVVVDSGTALMSEDPITIIPYAPQGVSLDAASVTGAEIHINSTLFQLVCLAPDSTPRSIADVAQQKAETVPIDDPRFYREAKLFTDKQLRDFLSSKGVTITGGAATSSGRLTPLTRETALDLLDDLKRAGKNTISESELQAGIRGVVAESLAVRQADPRISDQLTFDLCGNIATNNNRPPVLQAGDYDVQNGADGRRSVRMTESGKQRVRTYLGTQGRSDMSLETEVVGKSELYLEAQQFARNVQDSVADIESSWSEQQVQRRSQELLNRTTPLDYGERVEAAALVCRAIRIKKGFSLTAGQIMSGYIGSLADNKTPINVNFETGEGKTETQALDEFLSIIGTNRRLVVNTSTCDPFAIKNFNDTSEVLRFLGVETMLVKRDAADSQIRLAFADRGRKRVVFCDSDTPRFAQLFTVNPQGGGLPTFVASDHMKLIVDEGDYGIWDLRNNPAIITTGGASKSADADKVLLAEELVRDWFEGVELKKGSSGFVSSADSRENISLSDAGVRHISGKILRQGWAIEEISPYIRNALIAHKYMVPGVDFKSVGEFVFMRRYVLRNPSTGRDMYGMQLDLDMHKALQAMIGVRKITDPGVPPISITVPEYLKGIAYSTYSGTWVPLQYAQAADGTLTFSTESSFARARVDNQGVVFRTPQDQLSAVIKRAVSDVTSEARPGACLIHAAAQTTTAGTGVLSIQDVYEGLKAEFSPLNYDIKETRDRKSFVVIDRSNNEVALRVMILVDDADIKKEETLSERIGERKTITITDIASRAMNPKISKAVENIGGKVHLSTIVTGWDKSIRDYMQRIARAGRPDPKSGKRMQASSAGIFNSEDRNFTQDMRAFLSWSIDQNSGNPVVIIPPEFPMTNSEYKPEMMIGDVRTQIDYLERAHVISADKKQDLLVRLDDIEARLDGSNEMQIKREVLAVATSIGVETHSIVGQYWLSAEQRNIEEIQRGEQQRGEFDKRYAETLKGLSVVGQRIEGPELVQEIFGNALKDTIDEAMRFCGISDSSDKSEWDIAKFESEMKRLGFEVTVDLQTINSAEEIRVAMRNLIDRLTKNPDIDPAQRQRLVQEIKEQLGQLKLEYEACKRQVANRPDAGRLGQMLDREFSRRLSVVVAYGRTDAGFSKQTVLDDVTSLPRTSFRLRMSSVRRLSPAKALGAGRIEYSIQGNPDINIETSLEFKVKTLVDNNGHLPDAAPAATVTIDGLEFDLRKQSDIKALNIKLKEIGSSKRIYFNPHTREYIYGTASEITNVGRTERQIVFITEEVISPTIRDWAVAFIPRTRENLFGDEPRHETVIRQKAVEESYDRMVDSAFKPEAHLLPGAQFAEAIFAIQGITGPDTAREETNDRRKAVVDATISAVSSHESGHADIFAKPEYDSINRARHLSPLMDELVESLADIRIMKDIAGETSGGGTVPADQQTKLLSHLYYLANKTNGLFSKDVMSVLETCLDQRAGINIPMLSREISRLEGFLESQIRGINTEINGKTEQQQLDILRQRERAVKRGLAERASDNISSSAGSSLSSLPESSGLVDSENETHKKRMTSIRSEMLAEYAMTGRKGVPESKAREIFAKFGATSEEIEEALKSNSGIILTGAHAGPGAVTPEQYSGIVSSAKKENSAEETRLINETLNNLESRGALPKGVAEALRTGKIKFCVVPERGWGNAGGDAFFGIEEGQVTIYLKESLFKKSGLDRLVGAIFKSSTDKRVSDSISGAVTHEVSEVYLALGSLSGGQPLSEVEIHSIAAQVERSVATPLNRTRMSAKAANLPDVIPSACFILSDGRVGKIVRNSDGITFEIMEAERPLGINITENGNISGTRGQAVLFEKGGVFYARYADGSIYEYSAKGKNWADVTSVQDKTKAFSKEFLASSGMYVVMGTLIDNVFKYYKGKDPITAVSVLHDAKENFKGIAIFTGQAKIAEALNSFPKAKAGTFVFVYGSARNWQSGEQVIEGLGNIGAFELGTKLGARVPGPAWLKSAASLAFGLSAAKLGEEGARALASRLEGACNNQAVKALLDLSLLNAAFNPAEVIARKIFPEDEHPILQQTIALSGTAAEVALARKCFEQAGKGFFDKVSASAGERGQQVLVEMWKKAAYRLAEKELGKDAAKLGAESVIATYGAKAAATVLFEQAFAGLLAASYGFEGGRSSSGGWSGAVDLLKTEAGATLFASGSSALLALLAGKGTAGALAAIEMTGPIAIIAAGIFFDIGLVVAITDEWEKEASARTDSSLKEIELNRIAGFKMAQEGWISGVSSKGGRYGFSLDELRARFPFYSEVQLKRLEAVSRLYYSAPVSNTRWDPQGSKGYGSWDSFGSDLNLINEYFISDEWKPGEISDEEMVLYNSVDCRTGDAGRNNRLNATPGNLIAGRTGARLDSIGKNEFLAKFNNEKEFLDAMVPNWRYLVSKQSGQRERFESEMPQLFRCDTIRNFIVKIDGNDLVPRNLAEQYADDPSLLETVPPEEFWEKSGFGEFLSEEEISETARGHSERMESVQNFVMSNISEATLSMLTGNMINGVQNAGQNITYESLLHEAVNNYISLEKADFVEGKRNEQAGAIPYPDNLQIGLLPGFSNIWSQIKTVLSAKGVLRKACFKYGIESLEDLEKADPAVFTAIVGGSIKEILGLDESVGLLTPEIMQKLASIWQARKTSAVLPDGIGLLKIASSQQDTEIALCDVRDYPKLYAEVIDVLNKKNALKASIRDCGLSPDTDLATVSDMKLEEILNLAIGRALIANNHSVKRLNWGILEHDKYELPYINSHIASTLANPNMMRMAYFDPKGVRVIPMITP